MLRDYHYLKEIKITYSQMNRKLDTISMREVQTTCYIYTIYTSFLLFAAVAGGRSVKINIDGRQTEICESGDYTK